MELDDFGWNLDKKKQQHGQINETAETNKANEKNETNETLIWLGYTPIGQLDVVDGLVRGPLPPPSRADCEVCMYISNESRSKEREKAFAYAFDCDLFEPVRN